MEDTKFADLIDGLSTVATLDRWEPLYDKQLDYFYWKKPCLSKDVQIVKVSHETHLYLTPKGRIEGVFVEYLKANFAAHNSGYKEMTKIFTKKVDGHEFTIPSKNQAMVALFGRFAESLRADIYRDSMQDKQNMNDLECVIDQAITAKY